MDGELLQFCSLPTRAKSVLEFCVYFRVELSWLALLGDKTTFVRTCMIPEKPKTTGYDCNLDLDNVVMIFEKLIWCFSMTKGIL